MKVITILLMLFTLMACHRKDFFQSPDDIKPYVEKFIAAGQKRGISIHPEKGGLIIEFGTLEKHQLGKSRPKDYPKTITINQEIWQDLDTFQRRALIFHELAHCLLFRKHHNQLLPRGECASLLAGKEEGFQCFQNLYSDLWWNYYVDELFNPKLMLPNWYNDEFTNYQLDFQKTYLIRETNPIVQLDTSIKMSHLKKRYNNLVGRKGGLYFLDLDTTRNYQIEVTYQTAVDAFKTYKLLCGDLYFQVSLNYLSISTILVNNTQRKWGLSTNFYERQDVQNSQLKRLTIRKVGSLIYFFFNEKLIHIMEANYSRNSTTWWKHPVGKTLIETNFFSENEMELKVEAVYLK